MSISNTQNKTKVDWRCYYIIIVACRRPFSESGRRCAPNMANLDDENRPNSVWCRWQPKIIRKICMRWENRSTILFIPFSVIRCFRRFVFGADAVPLRLIKSKQTKATTDEVAVAKAMWSPSILNEIYCSSDTCERFSVSLCRWRKYGTSDAVKIFICSVTLRLVLVEASTHNEFTPAAAVAFQINELIKMQSIRRFAFRFSLHSAQCALWKFRIEYVRTQDQPITNTWDELKTF